MRNLLMFLCLALGLTATAHAQIKEACLASPVTYYVPTVKVDSVKRLPNGRDSIRAPLPHDGCVHMHTLIGWRYVWIKGGTMMRWYRRADESLALYAHDACGNSANDVAYPESAPTPIASPPPAREVVRIAPPQRSDLYIHSDTVVVKHVGTVNLNWPKESHHGNTLKVIAVSAGTAVAAIALGCVTDIIHCRPHDKPYVPPIIHTDSVTKPPVVHTDSGKTTQKPTGPGVGTDSAKTYDGRCQSNDPRNCPSGMRAHMELAYQPVYTPATIQPGVQPSFGVNRLGNNKIDVTFNVQGAVSIHDAEKFLHLIKH